MNLTLSELISKLPRSQEGTSQHQHNSNNTSQSHNEHQI